MPTSAPTLGLDFVGTISDAPEFFRILSHSWPGRVLVISAYDSVDELVRDLEEFEIRYDKAIAVPHNRSKAEIIAEEDVAFYFDDRPANLRDVRQETFCFLVRNADNFDHHRGQWLVN